MNRGRKNKKICQRRWSDDANKKICRCRWRRFIENIQVHWWKGGRSTHVLTQRPHYCIVKRKHISAAGFLKKNTNGIKRVRIDSPIGIRQSEGREGFENRVANERIGCWRDYEVYTEKQINIIKLSFEQDDKLLNLTTMPVFNNPLLSLKYHHCW